MSSKKKTRLNDEIRVLEVRLIDANGEQVGVVSIADALERAKAASLDLVEIVPNAEPPVCRIMDFGKYQFDKTKKQTSSKRKQKRVGLKEVKFRPGIEEQDYQVKLRNLIKFLEQGHRVKVTLRYRGRELSHHELGLKVLERVEQDLLEYGQIEQRPKLEGRQAIMLVVPKQT